MVDLNKFVKPQTVIVPFYNYSFTYKRKKYSFRIEDGWYEVELQGNICEVIRPVFIECEDLKDIKIIKGYTYFDKIIFQNFDVGKRKARYEVMTDLLLNKSTTFQPIEAIIWEDKKLYYYRPDYKDIFTHNLRGIHEAGTDLSSDIKGLTPELKTLYLFHEISTKKIQEELERLRKETALEELKKTIQGRLTLVFNAVNGEIIKYETVDNRIIIDWKLKSGNAFNSVIDANTFRVIEAGYCMSGFDKDHSLTSMVELAEDYEERDLIYKTRE